MKITIKKAALSSFLFLSLIIGSLGLTTCASSTSNSNKSYNVNVFDSSGNWYETGLLIKSNDKVYIKLSEGQFELIETEEAKKYTFELNGEKLYVW